MFSRATGAPRGLHLLCAIALLLPPSAMLYAQEAGTAAVRPPVASAGGATETGELRLVVGRSELVNVGQPITRISLTRPEIADAVVTGSQQILVHGKAPGTISMFVWDRTGGIKRYDVVVGRDLNDLNDQLKQLFPGENITAATNGKNVTLAGAVSSKYIIDKAAEVASGYVEKKDDVVNLLRQQEGIATNQVLLRVRFAEVNRSALTDLGLNLFSDGKNNYLGGSTTQQFTAPFFDQQNPMVGKNLVFSDYLNLFLFNSEHQIGLTVRALQNKGLLQTLAEPNLIAENGKEASFLAGGEYPYPVAQGTGSNVAVTIVFKEYGIRLSFLPELRGGDLVHLKVRPEVSSLDFANAISYQGFRIPALSTRRAETEVELQDGQTFAIAGLLNNSVASTMQKIPGIGDIPILGYLFRSKSAQKSQSELVVMITPQILRRGSMGAAKGLPNLVEPYLPTPKKLMPAPAPRMPGAEQNDAAAPVAAAPDAAPPAVAATPAPVPAMNAKQAAADKKAADEAAARKAADDRKAEAKAQRAQKKEQEAAAAQAAALEKAEAKQREADAKKALAQLQAEQQRLDAAKKLAAEASKEEARLLEARAKREAQATKQRVAVQPKQLDAENKRLKEIQDAKDRLRAAQAAYDAALERVKKNVTQ